VPDRSAGGRPGTGWETLPGLGDEADMDFDPAELREFLAADLLDVQADPVFKERLRQKLWRMVRTRYGGGSESD
jgi:hypothetical protein